jgi:hypothetical protein
MSSLLRRLWWPVVVAGIAALAVGGAFSLGRVFYLRDLAGYFWPHHLWLRRTIWSGSLPLWAPEPGLGYAAIADPNLQLLFPLTIAARILLPDVVGFNLMVALPVPLAALGAFLFLRRRFTEPAAAVGALVFALSGPFLSTVSAPNLSASAALVPWLLWTVDRFRQDLSLRRGAALAGMSAVQALAGEPLTLVTAGAIAFCFAVTMAREGGDSEPGPGRVAGGMLGWAVVGILLTSAQILPSADAAARSPRAAGLLLDGWSIHPLALLEAVAPSLFGGPVDAVSAWSPWLFPLNGGREPLLGSLYVGVGALALGMLGGIRSDRRRWVWFWSAVLLIAVVLALGYFTPVYPWLRSSVPWLSWIRYPAKFVVFVAVALGCLVAAGAEALSGRSSRVTGGSPLLASCVGLAAAAAGLLVLVSVLVAPAATVPTLEALARRTGLADAGGGAAYLADSIRVVAPRLVGLGAASAILLWVVGRRMRGASAARWIVLAAIVGDLLAANGSLNPTVPASWVAEPSWVAATRAHPEDRVYSGQTAILPPGDPELPGAIAVRGDTPAPAVTALVSAGLGTLPMAWGVRSALAPDLTQLRPIAYRALIERFGASSREARHRFLRHVGTRYHLALEPPPGAGPPLASLDPLVPVSLYEDPRPGPRARVVTAFRVVPDLRARIAELFAPRTPDSEVLLASPPPAPAGVPGEPALADARITHESATAMRISAAVPRGGGYLVVLDSYDPNWAAEVDGVPAPLLEADGLFRAVPLAPGRHEVSLRYRSRPLLVGLVLSAAAGLLLVVGCALRPHRGAATFAASRETRHEGASRAHSPRPRAPSDPAPAAGGRARSPRPRG